MAEDEEKARIIDVLKKNELEQVNNLRFNSTKLNNNIDMKINKETSAYELISYKPSIFQSFINKIKNIFNRGK
jgi:hypothetical protein